MRALSLILIFFLFNCTKKPVETIVTANNGDIEDFAQFDAKFHGDSLFQISRIKFPLEGHGRDGIAEKEWTKVNWEMLRTAVGDTSDIKEYKHKTIVTNSTITEKYWLPDSGFSTERRFENINGKWFLVYYKDINL